MRALLGGGKSPAAGEVLALAQREEAEPLRQTCRSGSASSIFYPGYVSDSTTYIERHGSNPAWLMNSSFSEKCRRSRS